jgi:DNA end-binding protein Ku
MKTMWKGAIQFGLVSIPVRMYTATEEKTVRFHQLHAADHGRVRYDRVCEACGEQVTFEDIVRGHEYAKGHYVVLSDDDLKAVPIRSNRAIEIEQFVDLAEVDPILYQRAYYLVPDEAGRKPYQLLRSVLVQTHKAAVAKIALHQKEHLSLVRPLGDLLVLETMFWPDEIRVAPAEEAPTGGFDLRPQEMAMAESFVQNLTEPWDPAAFHDDYREALQALIDAKIAGEEVTTAAEPPAGEVIDLMEALRASVAASETRKKEREAGGATGATGG